MRLCFLGVGYLVTCEKSRLQLYLLEVNYELAIEITGPRHAWIMEDLFASVAGAAVGPYPDKAEPLGRQCIGKRWSFIRVFRC